MNGYDFDNTILKGNTVRRFWWYCLPRFPYLILLLPVLVIACLLRVAHIIPHDLFLRMVEFFEFCVPNKKKHAKKFWNKNQKHIKQWYLDQKRADDIIVSASPDYLIGEICGCLGVEFIATKTRPNGLAAGKHCYGEEKVKEFEKAFPDQKLQTYYSDSFSDTPMFKFAQCGYRVRGNDILLVYKNGQRAL